MHRDAPQHKRKWKVHLDGGFTCFHKNKISFEMLPASHTQSNLLLLLNLKTNALHGLSEKIYQPEPAIKRGAPKRPKRHKHTQSLCRKKDRITHAQAVVPTKNACTIQRQNHALTGALAEWKLSHRRSARPASKRPRRSSAAASCRGSSCPASRRAASRAACRHPLNAAMRERVSTWLKATKSRAAFRLQEVKAAK